MTAKIPADSTSRFGRWPSGLPALSRDISRPFHGVGGLFMMSAEAVKFLFRRPFQAREFVEQAWFIVRVSMVPTLLVAMPFTAPAATSTSRGRSQCQETA